MNTALGIEPAPADLSSASDTRVFALRQLDARPVPVRRVPPYPPRSASGRGSAVIAFVVDTEGRTRDVHVVSTSDAEFGAAAERAVQRWLFEPGIMNGKPVNTAMEVPLEFSRND